MEIEIEIEEKALAVIGFAEMTAANSKLFRKRVCAALNGHTVVEINLSQTTFMDCAGLGALIAICNLVRGRKIRVRLINPTFRVYQLLHIMRAGQILEIVNRLESITPAIPLIEATAGNIRRGALLATEADTCATAIEEGLAPVTGK
jgi:anti-anti-sigma factor